MKESEILRLCRNVQAVKDDPELRQKAIAALIEAIRAEQRAIQWAIEARMAYREQFGV